VLDELLPQSGDIDGASFICTSAEGCVAQPLDAGPGCFEGILGVSRGAAVVAGDDKHPQGIAAVLFQRFRDGDEVANRLRHLFAAELKQGVVHPDAGERRVARVGLGLGDFVRVVGEYEVCAAAVDIDLFTEGIERHGGAFDVPAWPARAPGTFPARLAGLGGLPQGEIEGVSLEFGRVDAGAGEHVIDVALRESTVLLGTKFADPVVDVTTGFVCVVLRDKALDEFDDLWNDFRYAWVDVRRLDVHLVQLTVIVLDVLFGELQHGNAEPVRALDELVIDIGEILDVLDFNSAPVQISAQDIEDDGMEGVADVTFGIWGDSTDVQPHRAIGIHAAFKEVATFTGEGIEELHISSCRSLKYPS